MPRFSLIFALTLLFISPFASADIPHLISLQGKLTDASDNPVSSSTNFAFRIYDVPTGGTALWTEFQTITPDTLGIFSAFLGSVTALNIPFNESYWLEVKVNSEILSPRTRMGSAGYALRSESPWNATGNNIYATNAGNVGIGTTVPNSKLDIRHSDHPLRLTGPYPGNGDWYFQLGNDGYWNSGALYITNGYDVNVAPAKVTFDDNGNVGIGTTGPSDMLTVVGNIRATGGQAFSAAVDGKSMLTSQGLIVKHDFVSLSSPDPVGLAIAINRAAPAAVIKNSLGYALIVESGNVGIGTTGPTSTLHVNGVIKAETTTADTKITLNNAAGGNPWSIYSSGTSGLFGATNFGFRNDATGVNAITMSSSGNIGIGVVPSGAAKLEIAGIIKAENIGNNVALGRTVNTAGFSNAPTTPAKFVNGDLFDNTGEGWSLNNANPVTMTVDLGDLYHVAILSKISLRVDVAQGTMAYAKLQCSEDSILWTDCSTTVQNNQAVAKIVSLGNVLYTRYVRVYGWASSTLNTAMYNYYELKATRIA